MSVCLLTSFTLGYTLVCSSDDHSLVQREVLNTYIVSKQQDIYDIKHYRILDASL